jgi:alpha-beta hydrolase superfamily lysophospholipase
MALRAYQKAAMFALSIAAPRRLARILVKPFPQKMAGAPDFPGLVERIAFDTKGGATCRGWWVKPSGGQSRDRVVILAHGWTSHALRMGRFVEPLLQMGLQVMLYNARSHGDSDPFPVCSIVQFTEDVMAAVAFARQRAGSVVLLGHSLGAGASLLAAAEGAPVAGVIALAPPAHPVDGIADILRAERVRPELILRRCGEHVQEFIGRRWPEITPEERIREIGCPVLLAHGSADEVVPVAHFHRIGRNAGANVATCLVEGATHDGVKSAPVTLQRIRSFLAEM